MIDAHAHQHITELVTRNTALRESSESIIATALKILDRAQTAEAELKEARDIIRRVVEASREVESAVKRGYIVREDLFDKLNAAVSAAVEYEKKHG